MRRHSNSLGGNCPAPCGSHLLCPVLAIANATCVDDASSLACGHSESQDLHLIGFGSGQISRRATNFALTHLRLQRHRHQFVTHARLKAVGTSEEVDSDCRLRPFGVEQRLGIARHRARFPVTHHCRPESMAARPVAGRVTRYAPCSIRRVTNTMYHERQVWCVQFSR